MSADTKSRFSTPEIVLGFIQPMQTAENVRATNRALIDVLMNGGRPYTDQEQQENQIQINVNWGEGSKIIQDANRQVNNALLHKGNFFTATCLSGRVEKREEYGQKFTTNINRILKRGKSGKKYLFLLKNRNASLTLHGSGAVMWMNDYDWMPRFVALEDLLIPTDTNQDLCNLPYFAVNLNLTPYELMELTHGSNVQRGWNMDMVHKILDAYKDLNVNQNGYNWYEQPEAMQELWKQNGIPCNNDTAPKARFVAFYYRESKDNDSANDKWYRKIVLRDIPSNRGNVADIDSSKFVYDGKNIPLAGDIDHILHIQYADSNLVPPLKYHSVRGLGVMLYAIIECMNRLRCQFTQHTFESLMTILRVVNPTDRDRPKILQLQPYAVLEDGISFVPPEQRHQVEPRLVEAVMSEFRQLMSENSASYVQDIDSGTNKEQTLGEAQIKLQSSNKMVSSMLDMMYLMETFKDEEIVRRFLLPTTQDPDAVKFKAKCKADGIPDELMKPECWQIDEDRVMGGGDQSLALQETSLLLGQSQRFDPSSQRQILRSWTATVTRDPQKAALLVPEAPIKATAGAKEADRLFGTLMAGGKAEVAEGIEQEDYIGKMLQMMANKIDQAVPPEVGTPEDVIGLTTVGQDIFQHIALIAQDQTKKELVKKYSDALGKMMNMVKAMATRQQQAAEANGDGQDPKAAAEIQTMLMKAQIEGAIKQQKNAEKLRADKLKLMLSETRKSIEMMGSMEREKAQQEQELVFARMDKMIELANAENSNGNGSEN